MNPFSLRDKERMGIEFLERIFDVKILDCTAWLMPAVNRTSSRTSFERSNLIQVASLDQFEKIISSRPGGFAIDYVGPFSVATVFMLRALKKNGTRTIVVDSGAYPSPDIAFENKSLPAKLIDAIRQGMFRRMFEEKCVQWLLRISPDLSPDYALVAGSAWQSNPRYRKALNHIPAHSFDYEIYRKHCSTAKDAIEPYAVYLDEMIVGHDNNLEQGLPEPASAEAIFPALRSFFDNFESSTGIPVVIAAYPYANLDSYAADFGGRKVFKGQTAELVRDSSLVFAHASTSISFAVLWRKPLAFLTSDEICRSWYQPWIDAPRILLKAPLYNIDAQFPASLAKNWRHLDRHAYLQYEQTYIKGNDSPDISLWENFEALAA